MKIFALLILMAATASAGIVKKTIEYDHNGIKFDGYLAYGGGATPDTKRPGIVVVPEWWGLNDFAKNRADQLAEMGYVAFVADMYGGGANTTDATKAKALAGPLYGSPEMPARAQAALDQLVKTGLVDPSRLAAIGFCFGGSTCQTLAYSGAPIIGLVSFHGGLVQPKPDDLKNIHCKILMLNGGADPTIKPDAKTAFKKALDDGHIDYKWIDYPGALHAFTNPEADKLAAANNMVGTVGYNEAAAKGSWKEMQTFFNTLFAKK